MKMGVLMKLVRIESGIFLVDMVWVRVLMISRKVVLKIVVSGRVK